jgi:hypothetical protein
MLTDLWSLKKLRDLYLSRKAVIGQYQSFFIFYRIVIITDAAGKDIGKGDATGSVP